MIKFRKPKRHLGTLSVNCYSCGVRFYTTIPDNHNFKSEPAWHCKKCTCWWHSGLCIYDEKEAKKLGYYYCFACHKKFPYEQYVFPVCESCSERMSDEAEILRNLRDLDIDKND